MTWRYLLVTSSLSLAASAVRYTGYTENVPNGVSLPPYPLRPLADIGLHDPLPLASAGRDAGLQVRPSVPDSGSAHCKKANGAQVASAVNSLQRLHALRADLSLATMSYHHYVSDEQRLHAEVPASLHERSSAPMALLGVRFDRPDGCGAKRRASSPPMPARSTCCRFVYWPHSLRCRFSCTVALQKAQCKGCAAAVASAHPGRTRHERVQRVWRQVAHQIARIDYRHWSKLAAQLNAARLACPHGLFFGS
jgi:hypothetical protein